MASNVAKRRTVPSETPAECQKMEINVYCHFSEGLQDKPKIKTEITTQNS